MKTFKFVSCNKHRDPSIPYNSAFAVVSNGFFVHQLRKIGQIISFPLAKATKIKRL